jgi:predicted O-methyltransferase YrrM
LEPLLSLLRPGGLMIVDDVFCNGDALNERPATDKGRGVADLTTRVAAMPWLSPVILPMGNGQLMLLKPRDAAV